MQDKLHAPQNITAEPRDNSVIVRWDAVEGADGYTLYFFKASASRTCIKKRYAQGNEKKVLGFFNGEEYLVFVRAFIYDENGAETEGDASRRVTFIPISDKLKAQKVLCLKTGEVAQIDWEYRNKRPYALFYSEDEEIADVDRNGIVKALSPGRTEIAIVSEGQEIITKVYVDRGQSSAQAKAVMMFTGDIMCAVKFQNASSFRQFDFHDSFNEVRRILAESDFTAGVLETTCYDPYPYEFEQIRHESGVPNCNSPSTLLSAVSEAGFDMLVTANNQSCNTGYEGLSATVEGIKQLGMYNLGTMGDNPVMRDINGIRVAFIACTMVTNGQEADIPEITSDTIAKYSREYFRRIYDLARGGGAEYVVVYQHWGIMNSRAVTERQKAESEFMAECGADLIVGSHPHVIQNFRYIETSDGRKVPCAYSLGNFISSQSELHENRDSVILRVELIRSDDGIDTDISYIPCMSANSEYGVTVLPVSNYFNEESRKSFSRIKTSMGKSIAPNKYRPSVILSGSVILGRVFGTGNFARIDKTPLLLSQLTACAGDGENADGENGATALDIEKSFGKYIRESEADYIAVDFYTAAAVSCYERNGKLYTGTSHFLESRFYLDHESEFERIKPPFGEKFWKPLVKKYAEAVLSAFPSDRIILFRHHFPDKFVKGGSELRNIPARGSLNEQISAMEEYFISLTDPSVVRLSRHYFTVGDSPSKYEDEYFRDAYGAVKKIIENNRRCVDTPDPEIWFDRVLNYYDSMTARGYRSWILDMKNAADIIIAYTSKEFAAANRPRLLKLRAYNARGLGKISSFFREDKGAEKLVAAAKIISAVLSGNISEPYSFYLPAFEGNFGIVKNIAKLLSEKTGIYVSAETAEKVFLLKDRPKELEEYSKMIESRTADIWGSGITKEIFARTKNCGVGKYIFRQPAVLAFDAPVPLDIPEEASAFSGNSWRRDMIAASFLRNGAAELRKEHSKWLVVDFYDVICGMNEYGGALFEVDDFILKTDFYNSVRDYCKPCNIITKRTKEQCRDAITRFAWEMINIYGNNIVLITADLKDKFISLGYRLENLSSDQFFGKKRELIALCEDTFRKQTGCAVIDISKHFYSSDKFPLGGAHIVHYESEFYREAGVYLSHILGGGKQRLFTRADDAYIESRNIKLER